MWLLLVLRAHVFSSWSQSAQTGVMDSCNLQCAPFPSKVEFGDLNDDSSYLEQGGEHVEDMALFHDDPDLDLDVFDTDFSNLSNTDFVKMAQEAERASSRASGTSYSSHSDNMAPVERSPVHTETVKEDTSRIMGLKDLEDLDPVNEALAEISSVEEVFLETSAIDGAAGHRRSARGRSSRRRRGTRLLK